MSDDPILKASEESICSPESADGSLPFDWLDGLIIFPSGRAPARVSRSRSRGNGKASKTHVICGPICLDSSPSAVQQFSLANRLAELMDVDGSMEYSMTWKESVTPAGRRICRLAASGRRTSDKDYSGWPTPNTPSGGRSVSIEAMSSTGRTTDGRKHTVSLEHVSKFVGWPTTSARDEKNGQSNLFEQNSRPLSEVAMLALQSEDIGTTVMLSTAGTGSTAGSLNPAFSRWLQGYPEAWDVAAILAHRSIRMTRPKRGRCASKATVTASSPNSPPSSSEPILTSTPPRV